MGGQDWCSIRGDYPAALGSMYRWQVEQLQRFDPVAVLPVGAIEQHGDHLPLDVDAFLVTEIAAAANEIARKSICSILVPPIHVGYSAHHMGYCGTVSLSIETLIGVVRDTVQSLAYHGFRRVVLLNGHGGNTALLSLVASELRSRRVVPLVLAVDYWNLIVDVIEQVRETETGGMGHAGEFETSLMMHLRPASVASGFLKRSVPKPRMLYDSLDLVRKGPFTMPWLVDQDTPSGVVGDPTSATAEKGHLLFDAATARVADLIQEMQQLELTVAE